MEMDLTCSIAASSATPMAGSEPEQASSTPSLAGLSPGGPPPCRQYWDLHQEGAPSCSPMSGWRSPLVRGFVLLHAAGIELSIGKGHSPPSCHQDRAGAHHRRKRERKR
jgi:hypothetical protein